MICLPTAKLSVSLTMLHPASSRTFSNDKKIWPEAGFSRRSETLRRAWERTSQPFYRKAGPYPVCRQAGPYPVPLTPYLATRTSQLVPRNPYLVPRNSQHEKKFALSASILGFISRKPGFSSRTLVLLLIFWKVFDYFTPVKFWIPGVQTTKHKNTAGNHRFTISIYRKLTVKF